MSEIKLNIFELGGPKTGIVHGSIVDTCIAALSAEPETIPELELALRRYIQPAEAGEPQVLDSLEPGFDLQPYDAGVVVIDLVGRIVASDSTYSELKSQGEVPYHDGVSATQTMIMYKVPKDWQFLGCEQLDRYGPLAHEGAARRLKRAKFDARAVLFGWPMLKFLAIELAKIPVLEMDTKIVPSEKTAEEIVQLKEIHARWLTTPREDLTGMSPREVLLERQDEIDYDLHTRSIQWSLQEEGPPCLSVDSYAYKYAGFGTHEWVIYYDLIRTLLFSAPRFADLETEIERLSSWQKQFLENPCEDYDGRIPALLIENERMRLPIAMRAHDMVIDDDCPVCQMMKDDAQLGMQVGFWHLDGSHMDDDFAFSDLKTVEEWEARQKEWAEFTEKFNREWEERQLRDKQASEQPQLTESIDSPTA